MLFKLLIIFLKLQLLIIIFQLVFRLYFTVTDIFQLSLKVKRKLDSYSAPLWEFASEALMQGSYSFYAATTPHLLLPRKAFTRRRYHR